MAASCQTENDSVIEPISKSENAKLSTPDSMVFKQILEIGFKPDRIVDKGQYYLVDGDIRFDKRSQSEKARQIVINFTPLVGWDKSPSVTVRVDNSFSNNAWRQRVIDATNNAINSWNGISYCRVNITYVDQPTADITVRYNSSFEAGNYGFGSWPSNCNPGSTVDLNFQSETMTASRLHYTITHELGHNFGFMHTDLGSSSSIGFLVPYSPNSDAQSIMNSGPATGLTNDSNSIPEWSSFSEWDISAARSAYSSDDLFKIDIATVWGPYANGDWYCVNRWTISFFCSTNVMRKIIKNGQVISDISVANSGHDFNVLSPGTYNIVVYDANNPSRVLQTGDRTLYP